MTSEDEDTELNLWLGPSLKRACGLRSTAKVPPYHYRATIEKVMSWYELSAAEQETEKQHWKTLTRLQKQAINATIPGHQASQDARTARAAVPNVANRTRRRSAAPGGDRRRRRRAASTAAPPEPAAAADPMASTGLAHDSDRRAEKLESIRRKSRKNKNKEGYFRKVRRAKASFLKRAAKLLYLTSDAHPERPAGMDAFHLYAEYGDPQANLTSKNGGRMKHRRHQAKLIQEIVIVTGRAKKHKHIAKQAKRCTQIAKGEEDFMKDKHITILGQRGSNNVEEDVSAWIDREKEKRSRPRQT